jgi:hypothetical protein
MGKIVDFKFLFNIQILSVKGQDIGTVSDEWLFQLDLPKLNKTQNYYIKTLQS